MNVLQIDSSILGEHSVSRTLSAAIVARLRETTPGLALTYRDVATHPLPQFTGALAGALAVPPEQRSAELRRDTALLATVLEEVLAADVIVIGAPMYNFGLPSQLKAWLDALAVPGKTFRYTASGPEGLLGGKRAIIASSRGGFYGADTPRAPFEHQESHLVSFLNFVGITDIEVVRAEGVNLGPEVKQRELQRALQQAAELKAA